MHYRIRVADTADKITAIKLVRELTGLGLKASLDLVEARAFFEADREDATLRRIVEDGARAGVRFEFDPPLDLAVTAGGDVSGRPTGPTGEFAIRYRSGVNKIAAIKLVRELNPELGLANARDVVEGQGLVCTGVGAAEVERILGLFAELGASVEVERVAMTCAPEPNLPSPRAGKRPYGQASEDDDF